MNSLSHPHSDVWLPAWLQRKDEPLSGLSSELFAEGVSLNTLAARFGTPLYVYSKADLLCNWQNWQSGINALELNKQPVVCYAVKANSNLSLLKILADQGSYFDIVSGGELKRVLQVTDGSRIVFSGVGKSTAEIETALSAGIHCFNVESPSELMRLNRIAISMQRKAPIALRVNPDVDAKTHPYISTGLNNNKFGISLNDAKQLYLDAITMEGIQVLGISCHIGSQMVDSQPYFEAAQSVIQLVVELEHCGVRLTHIDLGGGLGIRYQNETIASVSDFLAPMQSLLSGRDETVFFEPGRSLVGSSGVLLTRVEYIKHNNHKNFAIVDAAMNDLIRPALYQAWHPVVNVSHRMNSKAADWQIVGPICESGDFLARDRVMSIQENDLLIIAQAGAYGMSAASQYNSRGRVAEVLVDGNSVTLIRRRETIEELMANELAELQEFNSLQT